MNAGSFIYGWRFRKWFKNLYFSLNIGFSLSAEDQQLLFDDLENMSMIPEPDSVVNVTSLPIQIRKVSNLQNLHGKTL